MARFFINRPIFACVIALLIILGGTLTVLDMPVAQYPNIAPPSVRVTATYPGASANIVEETVTAVVEQEMNGIEGLQSINSDSSSSGTANITITFKPGTN
ncbi:MAG TPA: acriflavin resistance protein, partial [Gammaproteobacteria bacterium]|nr:acriflavin resistance protein [Gammaproteobacteria bacterium]